MRRSESIAQQAAQPSELLGWPIGNIMSRETQRDNGKAIDKLNFKPDDEVIDIGTGHGQSLLSISHLASKGKVVGIDSSETMLGIAHRKN